MDASFPDVSLFTRRIGPGLDIHQSHSGSTIGDIGQYLRWSLLCLVRFHSYLKNLSEAYWKGCCHGCGRICRHSSSTQHAVSQLPDGKEERSPSRGKLGNKGIGAM